MTLAVTGLMVDNKPEQATLIKATLDLEVDKFGWRIAWTPCTSALQAKEEIAERRRQSIPPFDFAIVDYDLGKGMETGAAVVRELREQSDDTFILVVSSFAETYPDFQELSRIAGADDAINRGTFLVLERSEWSVARFVDRLRRHISGIRDTEELSVTFAANDPGIQATLYSLGSPSGGDAPIVVGERILRRLVIDTLRPSRSPSATFEVRHLAPGRSGARVCRVDRVEGGTTESFVLKVGLDLRSLDHERERNEAASAALRDILVRIEGAPQVHRSGYAAISAPLASRAVTLADWLGRKWTPPPSQPPVTADDVRKVADALFKEHLSGLLDHARSEKDVATWLTWTPVMVMRARETIAAYREVWGHPDGGDEEDAATLAAEFTDFVENGVLPGVAAKVRTRKTYYADAFGDLHSKNVLVRTGEVRSPVLVDASLYGPQHWAADVARLLVDLVLRVRRSGAPAMMWRDFADDRAYALGLCPLEDRAAPDESDLVDVFISHVLERLPTYRRFDDLDMLEPHWHWQWHVALAKEFVRQGTAPEPMPPRVVLALTSAVRHLRRAAELVNEVYG